MSSFLTRVFQLIQKSADDPKLNSAIKRAKDFRSLAANVVLWALPLVIGYGLTRLEAGLLGKKE